MTGHLPELLRSAPATAEGRGDVFRTDIQALRGYAVLLVLFYHAGVVGAPAAGYLGVDVFFVVSGFLITGILARSIRAGKFSFREFYFRRAKRLLPGAYVTLAATTVACHFLLTREESRDYLAQLIGAVTFTGNVVLWRQTGYFEGAADLKPLLHVWSLSLEEQYYLVVPLTLVLVTKRLWAAGAWAVVAGSLALCLVAVRLDPSATFYLLPTRAWELGIGSLGVLALGSTGNSRLLRAAFWPALVVLACVPFLPSSFAHPGLGALLVCVATLLVILRRHEGAGRLRIVRGAAWCGDISYSLYLVHWPLFALAASAWVSPVPEAVRAGLVVMSLLLAWLLYRYVENPIRQWTPVDKRPFVLAMALASAALMAGAALLYGVGDGSTRDFAEVRSPNVGFDSHCEYTDSFDDRPECRNSDDPHILVWGDSHAMHLVDGIVASTDDGVVQATKSACGPLLGVSYVSSNGGHNDVWAGKCIDFNESVLAHLRARPSITTVVLATVADQYLDGNELVVREQAADADQPHDTRIAGGQAIAADALARTVSEIRRAGRKVVFVSSMPMSGYDIGRCLEQRDAGKPALGADDASCAISEARYRKQRSGAITLIRQVATQADMPVIWLDRFLCRDGSCAVRLGETILYRDKAHLTHEGSRMLGKAIALGSLVETEAR